MAIDASDIIEESITIDSCAERMSAVLAFPFADAPRGAVLIAGPHPLMGGGLHNNVVRAVARGMAEHGFVSLRFAYAGDGPSTEAMHTFWHTGNAPDDPRRVDDALAALACLTSVCHGPVIMVGYSFGAWIISTVLSKSSPSHLVLIGPTLCQHQFDGIQRSAIPKLIITGDNDFATPLEATRAWFDHAESPKKLVIIESAEHFYRGLEDRLVTEIIQWM